MAEIIIVEDVHKPIDSGKRYNAGYGITISQWLKDHGMENLKKEVPLMLYDANKKDYILQKVWGRRKIKEKDKLVFVQHPQGLSLGAWALITSLVAVAASVAIALFLPTPETGLENREEPNSVYNLNGHNNKFKLGNPIEVSYGRNRHWPSYAAKPYTKYINNDQWSYSLFCLGQGEFDIERVQIEDTPIDNFQQVGYQVYGPGEDTTLFPNNVVTSTEVSNATLYAPNEDDYTGYLGGFVTNDAGTQTTFIECDIVFPQGLYIINDDNEEDEATVTALFEYREIDDNSIPVGSWQTLFEFSETLKTIDTQRFTVGQTVPAGRYEVRAQRTNNALTELSSQDTINWETLRCFLPNTKDYGNVTLIAVQAKATNNLNSSSANRINVIATRKLPTYSGGQWQEPSATRSLVWALCDVFRSTYGANVSDEYLDIETLQEMDLYFSSEGITFDWIFDKSITIWEAASTVARAGMAIPIMDGSQISLSIDRPEEIPTAVFSKANIIKDSFSEEYSLYDESEYDSIEIEYIDNVTFEKETVLCKVDDDPGLHPKTVQLHGVSDVAIAYQWGMRLRSQQRYLRKNYIFATGYEGNIPNYGDLIYVSHDLPRFGTSGIVKSIVGNTINLDKTVTFGSGTHYVGLRKTDGSMLGPYVCYGSGESNQIVVNNTIDTSSLTLDGGHNDAHWIFGGSEEFAKLCKVTAINPGDGENVSIRCVEYVSEIYDADGTLESSLPEGIFSGGSSGRGGSVVDVVPDLPEIFGLQVIDVPGEINMARASWTSSVGAQYYLVEISTDGVYYNLLGTTEQNSLKFSVTPGHYWVRVAGVNVGKGDWAVWAGQLGSSEYLAKVVSAEISALEEFDARADEHIQNINDYADQINARLSSEVDDLYDTIELNDAGYGATFTEIRDVISTETGELALQIEGVASKANENEAAVLQVSTALAGETLVRTEQYQILDASLTNAFNTISANSQLIQFNTQEINQIGPLTESTAASLDILENNLNNVIYDINVNTTAISSVQSDISNLWRDVNAQIIRINTIEATVNEDSATVSDLAEAFINENGVVSAGYRLKVDANGVTAGLTAIAKNDPTSPDISSIKLQAESLYFQLGGGRLYRFFEDSPVQQMTGPTTVSGDNAWKTRNIFIPVPYQVDPNTGQILSTNFGEQAAFKVYEVEGSDPNSYQPPTGYSPPTGEDPV